MSGGLCPSKSTVYISNLPFSLTNNDLHKILQKYGRVVKVTIVKDKETHQSRGVAFVLFLEKESAFKCVRALNRKELFGRTLKCSIAKDNGRTTEFIRRKYYTDKTQCYECGEIGHLSYVCPNNLLGDREPEKKKKKKRFQRDDESSEENVSDEDPGEDPALESLSAVIKEQQEKIEKERQQMNYGEIGLFSKDGETSIHSAVAQNSKSGAALKKRKYKKSDYFSDEEEVEED